MSWLNFVLIALGSALIVSGALAFARRRARASPEGEDERVYEGKSAQLVGALWIVLGAAVVVLALAPESAGGPIGWLRSLGRAFLGA